MAHQALKMMDVLPKTTLICITTEDLEHFKN